jgi:hypothetical protein
MFGLGQRRAAGQGGAEPGGPTVLFGLGVTKAGTSWLFRYLSGHPDGRLRRVKECHFFNTLEGVAPGRHEIALVRRASDLRARLASADLAPAARDRLRAEAEDVESFLAVLRGRDPVAHLAWLTEGAGVGQVVADITPAYGRLPGARLVQMAALGTATRFVFLMREPVARLWSHARMIARRRLGPDEAPVTAAASLARQAMEQALDGRAAHVMAAGDYRAQLPAILRAIPAARLMVAFFEDLFRPGLPERICAFLGIRPHPAPTGARVHEGLAIPLPDDLARRATAVLRPQFDFVAARGPVPEAWMRRFAEA